MLRRRVPAAPRRLRNRRGSALLLVLGITVALSALALSAIMLSSGSQLLSRYHERQRELEYAADAALAMTRSRLMRDSTPVPDTGYIRVLNGVPMFDASGQRIASISATTWVGGGNSIGRMATIVAEVKDSAGTRFVRRLDVARETFAQFAYWSGRELNGTTPTTFSGGERFNGAVWSNDTIRIASSGATFKGSVGTAKVVTNKQWAQMPKGAAEGQVPIALPTISDVAAYSSFATGANYHFNAANANDERTPQLRLEFMAFDLNGDGDSTDIDEGFFRAHVMTYTVSGSLDGYKYLRGDYGPYNCGDFHVLEAGGRPKFVPYYVHADAWVKSGLVAAGASNTSANSEISKTFDQVMNSAPPNVPLPRCFLGGSPQIVAVERGGYGTYTAAQSSKGGEDSTFSPAGHSGYWMRWPGAVDPRLTARRPWDAAYFYPLSSSLNPASNGVISVNGTVAISGVLNGRITLAATGYVVIVDDLRYASDPADDTSEDMLGVIAGRDIVIADNSFNTPPIVGAARKVLDETPDLYVHGVLMALGTIRAENSALGPTNTVSCGGVLVGRGCLYLTGGTIQSYPGYMNAANGTGFRKRYLFDRRALKHPPPRFPVTKRFTEDHTMDVDPQRFNPATYFTKLK